MVSPNDIVAEPSPIEVTLVHSDDSVPFEYAYTQEALKEALAHYANQISNRPKDIKVQLLHHLDLDRKQ